MRLESHFFGFTWAVKIDLKGTKFRIYSKVNAHDIGAQNKLKGRKILNFFFVIHFSWCLMKGTLNQISLYEFNASSTLIFG